MLNTPFPPWPNFTAEEAEAVASVLLSNRVNYWTGDEGREFEKEFAAWAGYWRKQLRCSWSSAVVISESGSPKRFVKDGKAQGGKWEIAGTQGHFRVRRVVKAAASFQSSHSHQ